MGSKREIRILIDSERYEVEASLFSEDDSIDTLLGMADIKDAEPEKMQIKTRGIFAFNDDGKVSVVADVTADDEEAVQSAAASCPVSAIEVE